MSEFKESKPTAEQAASQIKLMGFDVDGTLTDGGLYFGNDGEAQSDAVVYALGIKSDGVASGLTDTLTGILALHGGLAVAPRSAALHYADTRLGASGTAAELDTVPMGRTPVRLVASPSAATATSMRLPVRPNGGSSTVTMTAAVPTQAAVAIVATMTTA